MRVDVILSWGMQITSPVQRGSPLGGFLWSCIFSGEKKDSVRGVREMPRSCARVPHRVPHLVAHAVDKEILLLLVSSAQRTGVASELVRGSCRGVGHQEEMKGGWLICRWGLAACEEMPQTRRCSWQWWQQWRQLLWRFFVRVHAGGPGLGSEQGSGVCDEASRAHAGELFLWGRTREREGMPSGLLSCNFEEAPASFP